MQECALISVPDERRKFKEACCRELAAIDHHDVVLRRSDESRRKVLPSHNSNSQVPDEMERTNEMRMEGRAAQEDLVSIIILWRLPAIDTTFQAKRSGHGSWRGCSFATEPLQGSSINILVQRPIIKIMLVHILHSLSRGKVCKVLLSYYIPASLNSNSASFHGSSAIDTTNAVACCRAMWPLVCVVMAPF